MGRRGGEMSRTIRKVVLESFADGKTADEAWDIAKEQFPVLSVSWGYILRLKRAYDQRTDEPTDAGSVT